MCVLWLPFASRQVMEHKLIQLLVVLSLAHASVCVCLCLCVWVSVCVFHSLIYSTLSCTLSLSLSRSANSTQLALTTCPHKKTATYPFLHSARTLPVSHSATLSQSLVFRVSTQFYLLYICICSAADAKCPFQLLPPTHTHTHKLTYIEPHPALHPFNSDTLNVLAVGPHLWNCCFHVL